MIRTREDDVGSSRRDGDIGVGPSTKPLSSPLLCIFVIDHGIHSVDSSIIVPGIYILYFDVFSEIFKIIIAIFLNIGCSHTTNERIYSTCPIRLLIILKSIIR
jgi:hypothetical protein